MKILIDTHCWLWWIAAPEKLRDDVRTMIEDWRNTIFLSAASSWEIAIKCSIGKLQLPESPELFVPKRLSRDAISSLAVEHIHALHVSRLPYHHRDPFDRLIISQAQIEGIPILTIDHRFKPYDVELIWGA